MYNMGLFGKHSKEKYHSYKGNVGNGANNIINSNFNESSPLQKRTPDVSQSNFSWGKCYNYPILDIFSNGLFTMIYHRILF